MKKIVSRLMIISFATFAFVSCGGDSSEEGKEKDSKQTESGSDNSASSDDGSKTIAESEGIPEFKWENYDLSQFDEECVEAMKRSMEATQALRDAKSAWDEDPENRDLQFAWNDAVQENNATAHDETLVDCMDNPDFFTMYMDWKAWDSANSITEEDLEEMEEKAEELEKMAKELNEKYN